MISAVRPVARHCVFAIAVAVSTAAFAGAVSSANEPSIVTNPTWSPDGSDLAFAYVGASTYRIVTAPASGGGAVHTVFSAKSTDGCCDPILWSRTGRILFDSNFTLMSVRLNAGKPTRLTSNISWFILSPNGATTAFDGPQGHSPSGIGLASVSGAKPVLVPRPPSAADAVDGFSPDGTELVFTRGSLTGAGGGALMVEHVGGGAPVPLSRSGLIGASRLPMGAVQPQWSPDGRWIAFVRNGRLEAVSTRGSAPPRVLAAWLDGAFSWSPNSKLVACFCGPNREHVRFTTVNAQGTQRTVLWTNRSLHYVSEDSEDRPQWSPDGLRLVFMARVGPGNPPTQIWVVGADGHGLTRIA